MRRSAGVQMAATAIKFGVHSTVPAFLRGFGWESGAPRRVRVPGALSPARAQGAAAGWPRNSSAAAAAGVN